MCIMFLSTLPDLTPRDHHSLWYTARHGRTPVPHHLLAPHDPSSQQQQQQHQSHDALLASTIPNAHHHTGGQHAHAHHHHHQHNPLRDRDARRALLERTPLARLRHEEAVMDRRRANVANYGTQWLKPPGVAKTLFQLREERREAEEHAEAVRRERTLAEQMAEAAAEGDGVEGGMLMEMGEDEDEVDLDGDVPEAEGFGFDGEDSGEDMLTDSEEELEVTEVEDTHGNAGAALVDAAEEVQVREVRAAEDRLMDMLAREDGTSEMGETFAEEGESREEMLEEDDVVNSQVTPPAAGNADATMGMDIDMDADLDGEIPDGDADGEYEHTDSDEGIDDSTREISFVGRRSSAMIRLGRQLRRSVHRTSLRSRGSLPHSEGLDVSELLSGEGSSFAEANSYQPHRG